MTYGNKDRCGACLGLLDKARPLSSFEAAFLMRVSPRTVTKWCDCGDLPHFKVNRDRRIERAVLLEFARSRDIPLNDGALHVLMVGFEQVHPVGLMVEAMGLEPHYARWEPFQWGLIVSSPYSWMRVIANIDRLVDEDHTTQDKMATQLDRLLMPVTAVATSGAMTRREIGLMLPRRWRFLDLRKYCRA